MQRPPGYRAVRFIIISALRPSLSAPCAITWSSAPIRGALFSAALRPEEPAPLDKLTDALEKFKAGSWQEHSETRLLHFLEGAMFSAEDNEKIKRACGQMLKAREDRLRQTLYHGVIKGQMPANIDLDFAAQLLSAVIFSGLGFERFMPAIDPILLQKDGVRRVMELLKHCTRPRP